MLNKRQYEEHYKLYKGYLEKTRSLIASPKSGREWKKEFNYNYSGAHLHRLYFDHIDSSPVSISEKFKNVLDANFSDWYQDFLETALACKPAGWAFLCYSHLDDSLYNITTDSHDSFIVGMEPLITLDMYEHAYFIQYGADKKKYVEEFVKNLNWKDIYETYVSLVN